MNETSREIDTPTPLTLYNTPDAHVRTHAPAVFFLLVALCIQRGPSGNLSIPAGGPGAAHFDRSCIVGPDRITRRILPTYRIYNFLRIPAGLSGTLLPPGSVHTGSVTYFTHVGMCTIRAAKCSCVVRTVQWRVVAGGRCVANLRGHGEHNPRMWLSGWS